MTDDQDDLSAHEAKRGWQRPDPGWMAMADAKLQEELGDSLVAKTHELLEQKRILISVNIPGARRQGAVYAYVLGDHEPYIVVADNDAVRCSCWAARMGQDCAHRLAAMIAWAEQAGAA